MYVFRFLVILMFVGFSACATTPPATQALKEGYVAFDREEYEEALQHFSKAYEEAIKVHLTTPAARILRDMGDTYVVLGKREKALKAYQLALNHVYDRGVEGAELRERIRTIDERFDPPVLIVEDTQFNDSSSSSPNNHLDAGEKAILYVRVANQGKGDGLEVTLALTSEQGEFIQFEPRFELGTIRHGEMKEVRIPIEGKTDLGDGLASVRIHVKEGRGRDAQPVSVPIQTGRLKPPDLVIKFVRFDDGVSRTARGNGNGKLDAWDQAELLLEVQNQGEGIAYEVTPEVSILKGRDFTVGKIGSLGTILGGKRKELRVPVVSGLNLTSGEARLQIGAKEKRGFDARKLNVAFSTERLKRPDLTITLVRINDGAEGLASGNGNGIIENGETAEAEVFVENRGEGEAYKVRLSLVEVPLGIQVVKGEHDIGQIGVGETAKGKVVINIPRHLQVNEFKAKFRVEEIERKAARAEKEFALKASAVKPELAAGITWSDAPHGEARSNNGNGIWEGGEIIEGVLTVHNRGQMVAENVKVTVQVSGNVEIQQKDFRIGRLGSNQTSNPFRTTLSIPRTFKGEKAVIETVVEQQDFPNSGERHVQQIAMRRPGLVVMRRLLNQTGTRGGTIGSVQQGENTKVEIRVGNEGDLEAKGVTVSVISGRPEIRLEGMSRYPIGTIMPGRVSEPIVIPVIVQRSAPVGQSGVEIEITQDDFPSIADASVLMVREEGVEEIKVAGTETTL